MTQATGHGFYQTKQTRHLVEAPLRSKEPLPQTSEKMGHFKLHVHVTGSPSEVKVLQAQNKKLDYEVVPDPTSGL